MERTKCFVCGESVSAFISFGRMPIANGFLSPEEFIRTNLVPPSLLGRFLETLELA